MRQRIGFNACKPAILFLLILICRKLPCRF
jgi:hypothetical protein